ncbi:nitrogen fixation protein NifR [Staphylococcus aureus]|nr:nitrogen fixation protein NifR [Staphylococcus aureus]MBG1189720.1 nitrogen fixation protein NifR [Staphylococcus aureus]MBM0834476.1 nitrogen fixation protein NifR [Staphylococcus aureus]NAN25297.1 nitrogen fixation protein NifR [Staphylococcus aureus]PGG82835.1 nitrogen fixation protein NifR [Staphylococcus aureus]
MQVGVGRRNKFCENIISVPLPITIKRMIIYFHEFKTQYYSTIPVSFYFRGCQEQRI